MAINANQRNDYVGTGATATYPYTFKIFAETDLEVYVLASGDTAPRLLSWPTDFSVTGAGASAGGTIVLTAGSLAALSLLSIRRKRALTQATRLSNQSAYQADTHENTFDALAMIDQQQQDQLDRSLHVREVISPGVVDLALPTPSPGQALAWNNSGTGFTNIPTTGITIANFTSKVRAADVFSGSAASAKIAAAIADLPSTGGTVDARGLEGAQTWSANPFAGLSASKPVQVLLGAGVTTVGLDMTVPANVSLVFTQGAILSTSGYTLTIQGHIIAGMHKIFAGTTVPAMASAISVVYPQWFGAVADGVTDDTTPVQSAVDAIISGGLLNKIQNAPSGSVLFTNSTYYITEPISTCHHDGCPGGGSIPAGTINACVALKGDNRGQSILFTDQSIDMIQMYSWSCPSVVEDMYITGSATTVGVRVRGNQTTLKRNWFLADHGVIIETTAAINTTGTILMDNQCDATELGGPGGCITVTRSGGSDTSPNNIQVLNQHCYGGAWCFLADHLWRSRIDGMTHEGPGTYFISLAGGAANMIVDVAIDNATSVGSGVNESPTCDGIEIINANGVTLNNPVLTGFQGPGINIQNSTGVVLTGVVLKDNAQNGGTSFPYDLYANNSDVTIKGISISNASGAPAHAVHFAGTGPAGSYDLDGAFITGSKYTGNVITAAAGSGGMYRVSIVNAELRNVNSTNAITIDIGATQALHVSNVRVTHAAAVTTWLRSSGAATQNALGGNLPDQGNIIMNGVAFNSNTAGVFNVTTPLAEQYVGNLHTATNGGLFFGAITFALLGAQGNGTVYYCSDCTIANPCAGSGTGALAKKLNGVWVCN